MDLQALTLVALVNRHQPASAADDEESYYQQMGKQIWCIPSILSAIKAIAHLFQKTRQQAGPDHYSPRRKAITG